MGKTDRETDPVPSTSKAKTGKKRQKLPPPVVPTESSDDSLALPNADQETKDPLVTKLIAAALRTTKDLEKQILASEDKEGREKMRVSIGSSAKMPVDDQKPCSSTSSNAMIADQDESSAGMNRMAVEMIVLPHYYNPWLSPVVPARLSNGDTVSEIDYVAKTYTVSQTVDSECGLAYELPAVTKLPAYFAWSPLPRNEVVEDERVFTSLPSFNELDDKFIKEYAKEFQKTVEHVDCRRVRNLLLTQKWIPKMVESVKAAYDTAVFSEPGPSSPSSTIPEKVFVAISEAFGGSECPVGIRDRYYKAIGEPRQTFLQNLNATTGKPPTVARFLDSCSRLLCKRCFRYDCLEHPFQTIRTPKIFSVCAPLSAQKRCGDNCHLYKTKASRAIPAPLTLADSVILKTFLTDGEEDVHTYCDMAVYIGRPCWETQILMQELLRSPEETTGVEELNGLTNIRGGRVRSQNVTRRFTKAPAGIRMRQDLKHDGHVKHFQYIPCSHDHLNNKCDDDEICTCVDRRTFCERYCDCGVNCPNRFGGCNCTTDCKTGRCPCYVARRECDPEVCKCAAKLAKGGCCKNTAILFNSKRKVKCGPSDVHGWGAYIMEDTKAGDFISEYTGEVISQEEADRRGKLYDRLKISYLFNLNQEYVVDAARKGNKIRYANHSKLTPNCRPEIFRVQGDNRIGIFAKRDITAGEELFFDYSYSAESLKFIQIEPSKQNNQQQRNGVGNDFRVACIAENVGARTVRKGKKHAKATVDKPPTSPVKMTFKEQESNIQCTVATLAYDNSDDEEKNDEQLQIIIKDFELVEATVLKTIRGEDTITTGTEPMRSTREEVQQAYRANFSSFESVLAGNSQVNEVWPILRTIALRADTIGARTVPARILDNSPSTSASESPPTVHTISTPRKPTSVCSSPSRGKK